VMTMRVDRCLLPCSVISLNRKLQRARACAHARSFT
jgi:hypothetical protein